MIRVLVAATTAVMRAGLEAVIAANPDCVVVRPTIRSAALPQAIAETSPDVVLLELDWRDSEPAPSLPSTGNHADAPALVVLCDTPQGLWLADALRAGTKAVLPRDATAGEITAAVVSAATGLVTLHSSVIAELLPAFAIPARTLPSTTGGQLLTAREVEVLDLLAQGTGNKIIARQLGISEHTVKFHVSSIFTKLNATSRTEAVTIGARQGLIML